MQIATVRNTRSESGERGSTDRVAVFISGWKQRILHLLASGVLGTYVYSPWGSDPTFSAIVKFGIIPILTVTGLVI